MSSLIDRINERKNVNSPAVVEACGVKWHVARYARAEEHGVVLKALAETAKMDLPDNVAAQQAKGVAVILERFKVLRKHIKDYDCEGKSDEVKVKHLLDELTFQEVQELVEGVAEAFSIDEREAEGNA